MTDDARTAETRALYAVVADTYAEVLPDVRAEAPFELALIERFVATLPEGDAPVLDAGCGTGRMLAHLAVLGVTPLTGADLSPEMLAHAGAAHPEIPLHVADLRRLPFADGSLRGILCWYAVIHSTDAQVAEMAAEFARVLAPGAPILLGFQAGAGERVAERAYGHDVTLRGVLHEPEEIAALLANAGFEVVSADRRAPVGHERHPQGFVSAHLRSGGEILTGGAMTREAPPEGISPPDGTRIAAPLRRAASPAGRCAARRAGAPGRCG